MKKQFLQIVLLLIGLVSYAQTGEISGLILDKEYQNQPLPFADVYVKGTTIGASTDFEGKFKITNAPVGNQTLIVSFIGYESKEVAVLVEEGKASTVNVTLSAGQTLEGVVVQGTSAVKESDNALLRQQKKAAIAIESIGSVDLSRKGVSDASGAVAKISGISKGGSSGGGNVYVRGLGDRYLNTTLNGLPLPSNDVEKKNIDLNLFSSDIIQNIGVSKAYSSGLYGDFAAGNININSKEHTGKAFLNVSVGSNLNTEAVGEQSFRSEGTGFTGFFDRHSVNPFNISVNDPVDPIDPNINTGISASISAGKKWDLGDESRLSLFGAASFDSGFEFREGPVVDFSLTENQAFPRAIEYEFGRTTTLIGSAVYKLNSKNKFKFTSLYVNDATDEVGFYGVDGLGRNRNANDEEDFGFFVSNTQFDQNTIVVNQLLGQHKLSEKLKLEWAVGYNQVFARQPDRRRFSFERFDLTLDDDPTTNATFFNNVNFDNQRYFQDIVDDEINGRLKFNYKVNEKLKFDLGYNYRNKERDFQNIRYGFAFGSNDVEVIDPTRLNGVINTESLRNGLFDIRVINTTNTFAFGEGELEVGTAENFYVGELEVHSGFVSANWNVSEKLLLVPGVRVEDFNQQIVYDAINIRANDPRFQEADELFVLPSLNAKYALSDNKNLRLSASRTVSNPEFKEVSPHVYEDVTVREGGNPELLGDTPFSDIYNVDAKFEYFPDTGELVSVAVFGKQINDPVNKVIANDATGVRRFFRTGDKAEVLGVELEAKKKLIKNEDDAAILTGGFNFSYTYTEQDLKDVTGEGFTTSFDRDSDELQGASPVIVNADVTYIPNVFGYKPQLTVVYSQYSDRIDALGAGTQGNIIEKSVPTLDFVFKNSFTEKIDFTLAVKNILNPNVDFVRENEGQDILLRRYRTGLNIGFNFKYKF